MDEESVIYGIGGREGLGRGQGFCYGVNNGENSAISPPGTGEFHSQMNNGNKEQWCGKLSGL